MVQEPRNSSNNPDQKQQKKKKSDEDYSRIIFFVFVVLGFFMLLQVFSGTKDPSGRLSYSAFMDMLKRNPETGEIVQCELTDNILRGKLSDGQPFTIFIPPNDITLIPLLSENIPEFFINSPNDFLKNIFYSILPMLLFFGLLYFFVYRGAQQGGGRILSFGKSRARKTDQNKQTITFKDVAGVEEAKEELTEIIEFLREPKKFQKLGGKIPKGVLLMGPPGSGKTLLAKAVSGEAEVPFYSISGSDFVEMFVGVGASRVRDLFEQGKKSARSSGKGSIIFIDEIDAVGRQRFAGIGGGHDEREQTLNALLVEMDGFDAFEGVILIGATNRPDVLDPALLRPGRFDRQIVVDIPDINGREQILKVHCRDITLADDVDLRKIARQTPGFSGADIANLVNEAALLAARHDKEVVSQSELGISIEKVMAGPERKSRIISKQEKEIVAVHESGHALVSLLVENSDPLHKVSIIPRGKAALGYTLQVPLEDRYLVSQKELLDKITVLLSGRAAEELLFDGVTTGASNDLEVATDYAHRMVCEFGMSKKLGNLTFGKKEHQVFLGRDLMNEKDYSEDTAVIIDKEVRSIIDSCYVCAREFLTTHKDKLFSLRDALLEKEVLDGEEVCDLLGLEHKKEGVEYINTENGSNNTDVSSEVKNGEEEGNEDVASEPSEDDGAVD
ncbi:ATP-dependent zinc metalloprotease FtsH [Candidatus Omnitrophota bacterium]